MELLIVLLLLSPAIYAQGYHHRKSNDPNDEPFLPIYPDYPYSPKLIKRGTERDQATQLTPELYAPKVDARDSYTASYSGNYQRDPYYPNYNPYSKTSLSPSTYSSYYGTTPYTYTNAPYYSSYSPPYTTTPAPFTPSPYSPPPYPNYYYQPPYYYPNYYNQPVFPPPPPTPAGLGYPKDSAAESDADDTEEKDDKEDKKEKKSGKGQKTRDGDASSQDLSGGLFVDGGNYLSGSTKDLDSQSSTYKTSSSYNQLESLGDLPLKNIPLPLPRTTYRVVSVAGQPVGPDYPLPPAYAKAQQLEHLMSQTLARLIAQGNTPQVSQYTSYDTNQSSVSRSIDPNAKEPQPYSLPNIIAKSGLGYLVNPSILAKLGIRQSNSGQTTPLTRSSKYSGNQYLQKSLTRVSTDDPEGVYVASKGGKGQGTAQSGDYENYDNPPSYDSPTSLDGTKGQSYENDQSSPSLSYQGQNFVTVQTPQAYNYQYANYNPSPASVQQQSQQYKTNLEDVNYGAKQNGKG